MAYAVAVNRRFFCNFRAMQIRVAYGTSQKTTTLYRGEFASLRDRDPAAYACAGLSHDTKFNLKQAVDLPYSTDWFSAPPPRHTAKHPCSARCTRPW